MVEAQLIHTLSSGDAVPNLDKLEIVTIGDSFFREAILATDEECSVTSYDTLEVAREKATNCNAIVLNADLLDVADPTSYQSLCSSERTLCCLLSSDWKTQNMPLRENIFRLRRPVTPMVIAFLLRRLREQTFQEIPVFFDAATGILNRAGIDSIYGPAWKRMLEAQSPISLLSIGINAFPEYMEKYGQDAANTLLNTIAQILTTFLRRKADLVVRNEKDNFFLLLPNTDTSGCQYVAQSLRKAADELREQRKDALSISVGALTCFRSTSKDLTWVLDYARKLLNKANNQNLDKIQVHTLR